MFQHKKYDHKFVESNAFEKWKSKGFFDFKQNDKEVFSIILPPPNVTGNLHLGHAYNSYLQDAIIRFKRLCGYNTLWIPGLDHASIATQSKYEKILHEQGKTRFDKSRKEFLSDLHAWSMTQANTIRSQWSKMGLCLSYNTESFTMDKHVEEAVYDCFVKMYNDGYIYQAEKLVNWDVQLQTAISDIEVVYKENNSKLFYFKYNIKGRSDFLVVATTRPETMFGDVCLVVNPTDERYKDYHNLKAINPANGSELPIILDEYVDIDFGTGVMKVTPAHDFNDYELAKKHNIKQYDSVLNKDGTLNAKAYDNLTQTSYDKIERFAARKKLVDTIKQAGNLVKIESITNNITYSDRSGTIIEPLISKQWFISMKKFANRIIEEQNKNPLVEFIPKRFNDSLLTWMNNIHDWCISRQLWWGHQLPVWYNKKDGSVYVSKTEPKDLENWTRDEDVLDTWFSSGLWPSATTKYYDSKFDNLITSNVLVTAYDILFFWISRMMFMTSYTEEKKAFNQVLIHGLIRDEHNRKMSKSLGNGIDPMELIDKFGNDALRLFFLSSSAMGEDLRFSEKKIEYYWTVLNKLWNSYNLISEAKYQDIDVLKKHFNIFDMWIYEQIKLFSIQNKKMLDQYNFSVSNKELINLFWNVFCNQYLEYVKSFIWDEKTKDITLSKILYFFNEFIKLFSVSAPFITDHLFYQIHSKHMWDNALYPDLSKTFEYDSVLINLFVEIDSSIRGYRITKNFSKKNIIEIELVCILEINENLLREHLLRQGIKLLKIKKEHDKKHTHFVCGDAIIELIMSEKDLEQDKNAQVKRRDFLLSEIKRAKNILSNKGFVAKAPKEKITEEKAKLEKFENELKFIQSILNN